MSNPSHLPDALNGLEDLRAFKYTNGPVTHKVYVAGSGPGVLLMHELPGMTPECIEVARLISSKGFTVYLPLFFGEPGQRSGKFDDIKAITHLCVHHEFNLLHKNGHSKITDWLRALCGKMNEETGGNGVGVIGMCLTGSIVLSVMLHPAVRVPVMCQPAIPFQLLPGHAESESLGVPRDDLDKAKQKALITPIMGFRFNTDIICRAERFNTLRAEFGSSFEGVEIETGKGNPGNIPNEEHSVLCGYYPGFDIHDENHPSRHALDAILSRFKRDLSASWRG